MAKVKNKTTETIKEKDTTVKKTATVTKRKSTSKKRQAEIIDVKEFQEVEAPVEEVKETPEDATKRLFGELQELVKPLYNWLATNFDINTSVVVRRDVIRVEHDTMILNVVVEQPTEAAQEIVEQK